MMMAMTLTVDTPPLLWCLALNQTIEMSLLGLKTQQYILNTDELWVCASSTHTAESDFYKAKTSPQCVV